MERGSVVMAPPKRKIVLQIEQGSDPIRGSLDDGRRIHRFTGWLELAGALRTALGLAPAPTVGKEP